MKQLAEGSGKRNGERKTVVRYQMSGNAVEGRKKNNAPGIILFNGYTGCILFTLELIYLSALNDICFVGQNVLNYRKNRLCR